MNKCKWTLWYPSKIFLKMGNPFKNRFPLWECVDLFISQMGKVFIKRLPVWGINRNFYFQNQLKWSVWSMVHAYRKCWIWWAKLPSEDPKFRPAKCPSGNLKYPSASPRGIWDCPWGILPCGIWDLPLAIWPPKSHSGNSNTTRLRLVVFELPSWDLWSNTPSMLQQGQGIYYNVMGEFLLFF